MGPSQNADLVTFHCPHTHARTVGECVAEFIHSSMRTLYANAYIDRYTNAKAHMKAMSTLSISKTVRHES